MVGDTDTRRIGMATSDFDTSDYITYSADYPVDDISSDNRLIMKGLIRQNLLLLFSSMGATLGKDSDGFLFLKYWKRKNVLNKYSQVIVRKPIIYLSGFCSRNRGIHWNR